MDTDKNRLVSDEEYERLLKEDPLMAAERFEEVPSHLEHAARMKLLGRRSAFVSFSSGGKLSQWAAGRRKEKARKEKDKRHEAAASRRRNR